MSIALRIHSSCIATAISIAVCGLMSLAVQPAIAQPAVAYVETGQYHLAAYGPIKTVPDAQAALQKAFADIIAKGGGVLIVPPSAPGDWKLENDAPSSTKPEAVSVTVIDRRFGYERILVPSNGKAAGGVWAAHHLERTVRQNIDMPFGVHSTQAIETNVAGGTTSYSSHTLEAAAKGTDRKVFVSTIRGLYTGMIVSLSNRPYSYAGPSTRGPVKALGWDKATRRHFVVLDLEYDHPQHALLNNKHVVNSMSVTDNSNSDNQSMGLMVTRNNYGMGDSFAISAKLRSMGNIMSGDGDEGALTYGADIVSEVNAFQSTVDAVDWQKQELIYVPGMVRNHTLGTSRPIINMNPTKWVNSGFAHIVAPGHADPWDPNDSRQTGKTFEKQMFPGGAIIGSKDSGWTPAVVGRFFAVDEPSEYLDPASDSGGGYAAAPRQRTYRWYLIQRLEDRPDGTKRLFVERTRWRSRDTQAPQLYDSQNYSWSGHERPLKYIIAPGAYVSDISRAWTNSEDIGGRVGAESPRTLKLAPNGDVGTRFDFQKGDPIVQAIGQDPWNPTGLRVRHHNMLPSTIEDSSVQSVNYGRVAVHSSFAIHGGSRNLDEQIKSSKDKQPAFLYGVDIGSTTKVGVSFKADTRDAAIQFEQPNNRAQPMQWFVNGAPSHSLVVHPQNGGFQFNGGGITVPRGGISGGDKAANNLRGIAVPVAAKLQTIKVQFARPEADANYAIMVQPNWITQDAVTEKTHEGFTVTFSTPPVNEGRIDWMLLR